MDNLVELELGTIQQGDALTAVNALLFKAARDVLARPGLKDPRTVTLKVSIAPDFDAETKKNYPNISWDVKQSIPGKKGLTTKAVVDDQAGTLFVSTIEDNARQGTLPLEFPRTAEPEGTGT